MRFQKSIALAAVLVTACSAADVTPAPTSAPFGAASSTYALDAPPLETTSALRTAMTTGSADAPVASKPAASAIRFIDTDRGWLGVEDGLLGTTDGGTTWIRELASERISHVWALDTTHAWALGVDNALYRTTNGAAWSRVPPTDPPIIDIQFVSPEVGWAITARQVTPSIGTPAARVSTLLRSKDGGRSWTAVYP